MKLKFFSQIFILLIFAIGTFSLKADNSTPQTPEGDFSKGVEAYTNGNFHESIKLFESTLGNGKVNFEIYYNLGNANYKINKFAEAVYYYEKALQLKPGDEDCVHNIGMAQAKLFGTIQEMPENFIQKFLNKSTKLFSPNSWGILIVILTILTLGILLYFLLADNHKLKKLLFFSFLLSLFLTFSSVFFGNRMYQSVINPTQAIVMTSSLGVKSSPDLSSADIHVVQAGTKVNILSTLGNWIEIRVPDGNKGWVQADAIRKI